MPSVTRPGAFEIPSERIALHFARLFDRLGEAMRPRICRECLARIEPWTEVEVTTLDGPRDREPELCRRCAAEAAGE